MVQRLLIIALSLPTCGFLGCSAECVPDEAPDKNIVVRLETPITHIVGPVDDAGYVDYLEAANIRYAKGVTADNNWEVVLQRVFGPLRDLDPQSEREYYRRLGISKPEVQPERGTFFQPWRSPQPDAAAFERKCYEQFSEIEGPWKTEDYPELAQWFQMQSKHLDDLIAGSHRPRNFIPHVMSADAHAAKVGRIRQFPGAAVTSKLIGDFNPHPAPLSRFHTNESTHRSRKFCRILLIRAYLRVGENDVPGAFSDLSAIRRIGRLLSRGGLLEYLSGRSFDTMADWGGAVLLQSGKLSEETCRRHLNELKQLSPFPSADAVLNVDGRHINLDALQFSARHRQETCQALRPSPEEIDESAIDALYAIDWNVAMRTLNERYDVAVLAAQESDPIKRQSLAKQYWRTRYSSDKSFLEKALHAAQTEPGELSQFMGNLTFEDTAPTGILNTGLEHQARGTVVRAAYAAHLYQTDHGSYPRSIDLITPILGKLPLDPFTGELLRLDSVDEEIIIYSVGLDRIDDKGHDWKDIAVRLRAGEPKDPRD